MLKAPLIFGAWKRVALLSMIVSLFAVISYYELFEHLTDVSVLLSSILLISFTTFFIGNTEGFVFLILTIVFWFVSNIHSFIENPSAIFLNQLPKPLFMILQYCLILYIKKIFVRIEELALVDDLTGINNRRGFCLLAEHELRRLHRKDEAVCVAFIDIDNFKQMNDTKGHKEGDKILIELSSVIQSSTRCSDVCGRIGGDEFCVLFSNVYPAAVQDIACRMNEHFKQKCANNHWTTSLSIGVLTTKKEVELDELLRRSDSLMYKAKNTGKNKIEFDNL